MALSIRTRIREKNWTKLLRELPEGIHELPGKFSSAELHTIRQMCWRESKYDTPFVYFPSISGNKMTITKKNK